MRLFPREWEAGVFRGFSAGGLEFHADIVLPYQNRFQAMPMHGLFVLVQLESEEEGVLGRITSVLSKGKLASGAGEDFGIRAAAEGRPIPEDLREQYLKYEVDIRVLGLVRQDSNEITFVASHRRLPHVGSKVAFLSPELLKELLGHNASGAELGFLSFGEFIYAKGDRRVKLEKWMRIVEPCVIPRFDVHALVRRRTFVFARAGFGKSNLVKLLFSNLYKGDTPCIEKRGERKVPVGTVIFDPDGEYFWPDDSGRPGLCDVPDLQDKIVVFTPREGPSKFYESFIGGPIRLDIRRLRPSDVISVALSPERQAQQNVRKIAQLNDADWREIVDLIYRDRHQADEGRVRALLKLNDSQEGELLAARANLVHIVAMLHDPSSQMLDMLLAALSEGKLCIVDISQMRGSAGLALSGILLRRIFENNQNQFTRAAPRTIPTIAVVEEAQSVLGSGGEVGGGPYIEWVKEGRKYDLGAVLITQQPGSIPNEILSQGDNWFLFHLLSAGDLAVVKSANAHFSGDLLSSLLNEPIEGHGIFWSSATRRPFPIPIRAMLFEGLYSAADPKYTRPGVETFAKALKARYAAAVATASKTNETAQPRTESKTDVDAPAEGELADSQTDVLETYSRAAIAHLKNNDELLQRIREQGVPWRGVQEELKKGLPDVVEGKDQFAYSLVRRAMDEIFGPQRQGWNTEARQKKGGPGTTTWVVARK